MTNDRELADRLDEWAAWDEDYTRMEAPGGGQATLAQDLPSAAARLRVLADLLDAIGDPAVYQHRHPLDVVNGFCVGCRIAAAVEHTQKKG